MERSLGAVSGWGPEVSLSVREKKSRLEHQGTQDWHVNVRLNVSYPRY